MKKRTQWLTVTALGIALFVVFSLVLRIPVFGRFYLCLGYLVMGIYCYSFGILSGTLVGALGVLFYCAIVSSFGGMVGWALGNVVIGISVGWVCRRTKSLRSELWQIVWIILAVILSTAVGMLLVKSAYESLLSGLPLGVRISANSAAFFADSAVLSVSIPIARSMKRILVKQFPKLCV